MSLYKGGLLSGLTYSGFGNYALVWKSSLFVQAVKNTAFYAVLAVPAALVLSLVTAVLTDRLPGRLQSFVRASLFLPLISSAVALSIIWQALLTPGADGPVNWLFGLIGVPPQNWLGDPDLVIPSIVAFEVWRGYGFWVIVFMAGLAAIPEELYDAAHVDGASAWQAFAHITLPQLKPTFLFLTVMGVIWNFQLFDAVFMLTSGGPANRSISIVYYVYRNAFHFDNLGFAATMSVLLFAVVMLFTLLQLRISRDSDE